MTDDRQPATAAGLQVDAQGRLRHLLTLEGLARHQVDALLERAEAFSGVAGRAIKKVPLLRGHTAVNLFFEPSTRTRTTFELAAKRLSADVLNINVDASAARKGESLLDTLRNLEAMQCDLFVVRHPAAGAAHFIASHVGPGVSVINAGDGRHAHPTQALLDAFTIRRHRPDVEALDVVIVGDIAHSRVARSEIHVLRTLGVRRLRVVAPRTLLPSGIEAMGVEVHERLESGIAGADVIIALRLQRERMRGALLPSAHEYYQTYGLTARRLRQHAPDALVMHPGPINRGVEIDSEVADGARSLILEQVANGIAVRMAVMATVAGRGGDGADPD